MLNVHQLDKQIDDGISYNMPNVCHNAILYETNTCSYSSMVLPTGLSEK